MNGRELATIRQQQLGLTQRQLAHELGTTRVTVARYEAGMRRISPAVERLVKQFSRRTELPMAGIVAAGKPIEPIEQSEPVEVPGEMIRGPENFALRVTGDSMREDGILPGDTVIVRKQAIANNGDTVIALVNGQATIKKYHRNRNSVELLPMNATMRPIIIQPNDDFRLQGIVIGLLRYYK